MDIADAATDIEERERLASIARARAAAAVVGTALVCRCCGDAVKPGASFCGIDCRDRFELEASACLRGGRWRGKRDPESGQE